MKDPDAYTGPTVEPIPPELWGEYKKAWIKRLRAEMTESGFWEALESADPPLWESWRIPSLLMDKAIARALDAYLDRCAEQQLSWGNVP